MALVNEQPRSKHPTSWSGGPCSAAWRGTQAESSARVHGRTEYEASYFAREPGIRPTLAGVKGKARDRQRATGGPRIVGSTLVKA